MSFYKLKLFTTHKNIDELSQQFILLLEQALPEQYELEVIDIETNPDVAERERIIATPTVIRYEPLPVRYMIGMFTTANQVIEQITLTTDLNHNND